MPGTPRSYQRQDGSTAYQARWRPPGDGRDSERRTKTFGSKREANRWISDMDAAHHRGTHTDPRHGGLRLDAVVAEWQEAEWHYLKPKTAAGYEHILRLHILPAFGDRRIVTVTPDAIQRWINGLAATHAPATTRNVYGVLARAMAFAVRRRYLPIDPTLSVKLPRSKHENAARRRAQVILEPHEIRALAGAMPTAGYGAAVLTAAYCGPRAGELWALLRRDINLVAGTLTIDRALSEVHMPTDDDQAEPEPSLVIGPPKSEAAHRTIAIPRPVQAVLAEHLAEPSSGCVVVPDEEGNLVFDRSDDPFHPDCLVFTTERGAPVRQTNFYRRIYKPAVREVAPAKSALRFHDLRHTAASLALSVAPNLHMVKERLGHEDIRTTVNTYGHMVPNVDAALADALGDLFDAAPPDNVRELPRRRDEGA
jgi:integrase